MRIEDRFTVPLSIEDAWEVLLDIERIAPCMPGAQLQEIEGDEYRGIVKVKLGAITAQFKGVAQFTEVDEAARRVVLRAEGREMRGQGNAAATVTASLQEADTGTEVVIDTDLSITGRVAQFGRGVMGDVSSKLLGEFARCLETDLLSGDGQADTTPPASSASPEPANPATAEPVPTAAAPQKRVIQAPEAKPVDLLAMAGPSVVQRILPVGVVVVLIVMALSDASTLRWVLAAVGAVLLGAQEALKRKS